MAADIAAKYSVWDEGGITNGIINGGGSMTEMNMVMSMSMDAVPVIYTDSKHVAKRGTKVRRTRKRKSMGRLMGRPSNVEDITKGLEPG